MSEGAKEELLACVEELTEIARTGQSIQLVSGLHMAWWGFVVATAAATSLIAIGQAWPTLDIHIWLCAMLIGWLGSRLLVRRSSNATNSGSSAAPNHSTRVIWLGIGIAATLVTLGEAADLFDFGGRAYFIIFLLCALGLLSTGAAAKEPLLYLSAAGWFGVGAVSLFLAPSNLVIYSATIIACLIFLVVPGLIIGARSA